MSEEKRDLYEEFDYFLGRINIASSWLDCRSIKFMNEFPKIVEAHVQKRISEIEKASEGSK